jgi:hypothetical protein
MRAVKVILWLLMSAVIVYGICEGTYLWLGNGVAGRVVCTVALMVVAPFLLRPLMYRQNSAGDQKKEQ